MNVHLLKHIPNCVRDWGPLWAYSCFSFESMNGHLKRYFHGTRCMNVQICQCAFTHVHMLTYISLQLAFSYVMMQTLPRSVMETSPNTYVKTYLTVYARMHYLLLLSDCSVLGSIHTIAIEADVRRAIYRRFKLDVSHASAFERAVIKGHEYHSKCYRRAQARNSYTVEYADGVMHGFGHINFFLSLPVAVVTPLIPTTDYCYPMQLSVLQRSIIPISVQPSVIVILLSFSVFILM